MMELLITMKTPKELFLVSGYSEAFKKIIGRRAVQALVILLGGILRHDSTNDADGRQHDEQHNSQSQGYEKTPDFFQHDVSPVI